jgi:hypothetical protein
VGVEILNAGGNDGVGGGGLGLGAVVEQEDVSTKMLHKRLVLLLYGACQMGDGVFGSCGIVRAEQSGAKGNGEFLKLQIHAPQGQQNLSLKEAVPAEYANIACLGGEGKSVQGAGKLPVQQNDDAVANMGAVFDDKGFAADDLAYKLHKSHLFHIL